MNIMGVFAAAQVSDMARAEAFYMKLIGRAPDHRPMSTLTQWVGVAGAGVQLFLDAAHAGHSRMTFVTPDIDAARGDLTAAGLSLGEAFRGDFGAVAQIDDPDGNVITLAEPPKSK